MNSAARMPKVLIVEDEVEIQRGLVRILTYTGKLPSGYIDLAGNSTDSKEKIDDFEPDIVLLDLKIPRVKGDTPDVINSNDVLNHIELTNYKFNKNIKVIIISASVKDKGTQKLILGDRSNIVKFLDKDERAIDSEEFGKELLRQIDKAMNEEPDEKRMDYSAIRRSVIRELKELNPELFNKIDKEVLSEFEKLNDKDTNTYKKSKDVMISCGEVVEDILAFFKSNATKLSSIKYSDDPSKVRNRLTSLTGRMPYFVKITDSDGEERNQLHFKYDEKNELISRVASESAYMAYFLRSEAVHGGKEDDERNIKLFANKYKFTREDAAVSVNLIMPLIRDYINYLKNQKKAK